MSKSQPEPDQTPWFRRWYLDVALSTCDFARMYTAITSDAKTAQEFERIRLRMLHRLKHPSPTRPTPTPAQSQISLFPEGNPTP